jgi:DNA (cytosine-5)-methyltransferase 1
LRFIDLFAGLGGFHLALKDLGHDCVFASEIDPALRKLYERNFGMPCAGDIREITPEEIPEHEILCAGFPCQPFSKAGRQKGLDHPELGELYKEIFRIIDHHKTQFLILENVPNLQRHGNGKIWKIIKDLLEQRKYKVDILTISPHKWGIPQIRNRIYIVASLGSDKALHVSKRILRGRKHKPTSLRPLLKEAPLDARAIPENVKVRLDAWQEFLDIMPKNERFPHPLWAMEFGATYPFKRTTPSALPTERLRRYRGSFGRRLSDGGRKLGERGRRRLAFSLLPSHARRRQSRFPEWKIRFIDKNREFYKKHKSLLRDWVKKIQEFPPSFQKFEWNCIEEDPTKEDRRLGECVVQVRPSGVRAKRPDTMPSLVAMNATQVPIIMWEGRYMTPLEGKLLQSMDKLQYLPDSPSKSYEALGNAVNVRVARRVALALVGHAPKKTVSVAPIVPSQKALKVQRLEIAITPSGRSL